MVTVGVHPIDASIVIADALIEKCPGTLTYSDHAEHSAGMATWTCGICGSENVSDVTE